MRHFVLRNPGDLLLILDAAPIPTSSAVMNCLKDVYDECVKLGIPITKRLKEVQTAI
jgi:hypothetical protein